MLVSPQFKRLLNVQCVAAWLRLSVATSLVVALAASLAQAQVPRKGDANDRSASATEGLANSSARPKRVALVVGNSDYAVRHLPNAKNDADDMGAILKTFGFEVEVIKNVEKKALGRAVTAFGEKAYGAEAALFFFAGHGSQEKGRNYLWPLGANPKDIGDAEDELFNLNRVLDEIEGKARTSIVILDACRDAPLTGKARSSGAGGFKEVQTPDGTVVVFATAANRTADDGRDRNGVFTGALLKAMRGNDLSLGGVLSATAVEVARVKPTQRPYVNGDELTRANFFFSFTLPMSAERANATFERIRIPSESKLLSKQELDAMWTSCLVSPVFQRHRAGKNFYPYHSVTNRTNDEMIIDEAISFVQMQINPDYDFSNPPIIAAVKTNQSIPPGAQDSVIFGSSGRALAPTPRANAKRTQDALTILYLTAYGKRRDVSSLLVGPFYDTNCAAVEITWCGDGIVDETDGESCDDGPLNGSPGRCNSTCSARTP